MLKGLREKVGLGSPPVQLHVKDRLNGSVPRNKKQVSNVKRSIKKEPGDADPLFAVMEESPQKR